MGLLALAIARGSISWCFQNAADRQIRSGWLVARGSPVRKRSIARRGDRAPPNLPRVMRSPGFAIVVALASSSQEEEASPARSQVRVIERGTGRVVEGATVERLAREVQVYDSWWYRIT